MWRLAARLVSRPDADDVTQDVFVRVMRALPDYRGDASARTWILVIARRTCADAVRTATRRRRRDAAISTRDDAPDTTGRVVVDDLLARLDPERREAFVLTQLTGCSYAEAATICDVPVGTIRSRVARARADLIDAIGTAVGE